MASNLDVREVTEYIKRKMDESVKKALNETSTYDETMYVRGKHAALKQFLIDLKLERN